MRPDQPSWTARSVATSVLLLHDDVTYGRLVDPLSVDMTLRILGHGSSASAVASSLLNLEAVREMRLLIESWVIPGLSIHIAARKRWIEMRAREYLVGPRTQLVVLGAGYDTLAFRLQAELQGLSAWEIDHPATQECKRRALDPLTSSTDSLFYLSSDFADSSPAAALCAHAHWDPTVPTVFVTEGLLMYLDSAAARRLLLLPHDLGASDGLMIGSALCPDQENRLRLQGSSEWIDRSLALAREPFPMGPREAGARDADDAVGVPFDRDDGCRNGAFRTAREAQP